MKINYLTIIFLIIVLNFNVYSIRPPKEGVKVSAELVEEFKLIQQSYKTGYWAETIAKRYEDIEKNIEYYKKHQSTKVDSIFAPTLLGYFTDLLPTYTKAQFQAQLWDGPNPSGTITDYFREISYGKMHLSGKCEGWFPVQGPVSAYNPGSSSGGPKFTYELLVASDAEVDYRQYIQYYDSQGNGHVPFLVVVHTGGDAASGAPNIWSHRWDFRNYSGSSYITNDILPNGKRVIVDGPYAIQPEMTGNQNTGGAIEPIGVFVHELGHIFNLPDLYDISGRGEGLGGWCLMASGSYGGDQRHSHLPSHMSAWCKIRLGWIIPENITTTLNNHFLPPVENNPIVYRLWRNGSQGSQYFLIENRQKIGFDVSLIESGLLIYHVDDAVNAQNNPDRYKVDLEQADGIRHLNLGTNRGDAGDPFPGVGGSNNPNTIFDGYSTPNSRDYSNLLTGVNINSIRKIDTMIALNLTIWDTATVVPAFTNATPTVLNDSSENYGTAIIDFNNDGLIDIYVASKTTNKLFKNNGDGTFIEMATSAGVADPDQNRAVAVGDFDNDGFEDLLVTTYNPIPILRKKNKLYKNNGDGTFSLQTASPIYYDDRSAGANFVDFNNDGFIDIFILSELNTVKAKLFKNNGDGTFSIDTTSGLDYQAKGSSAVWGDFNNDGFIDVYIVTKDENVPGMLFKNNGDGTFSDVTTIAGVENMSFGNGAAWGDYNNDGFLDLIVCNEGAPNKLYKNNGDETFTEIGLIAGISDGGINYSPLWLDFNLDGYLDVYITRTGPNRLFKNNGDGTFTDVAGRMGVSNKNLYKGSAILDFDRNGLPDIFIASGVKTTGNILFKHTPSQSNWATITVKGKPSNRSAIGTRIICYSGDLMQIREVNSGSGYFSHNSFTQFFGFGNNSIIDTLIIKFPSGYIYKTFNLNTNQNYSFDEGILSSKDFTTIPNKFQLYQNYPNPFNSTTVIKFEIPAESFVTLKIYDILGKYIATIFEESAKPGTYTINFSTKDYLELSSGVYFYRLQADKFIETKKFLLMK